MWSDDVPSTGGAGAWSSLRLVCLPSSSSNALVTAAFTPILATRTRLVSVRRHIGVTKATEIISCSDILHPGSLSRRTWRQVPRFFPRLDTWRQVEGRKKQCRGWGQRATVKGRTVIEAPLFSFECQAAQARPSSRQGRILAALEQTLFWAVALVTTTTWTFMISTLIPIPNQHAEPRG